MNDISTILYRKNGKLKDILIFLSKDTSIISISAFCQQDVKPCERQRKEEAKIGGTLHIEYHHSLWYKLTLSGKDQQKKLFPPKKNICVWFKTIPWGGEEFIQINWQGHKWTQMNISNNLKDPEKESKNRQKGH